jgi:uncharacterized protein (DUF2267 family)
MCASAERLPMNYDEFTGTVAHRLELPGTGETVRAIRATLMPLGQRLQADEAKDLASTLPMEIGWYLTGPVEESGQRFGWREYVERVSAIDKSEFPEAAYRAQVVMDLVGEVVPEAELRQIREQLPESQNDENWRKLFAVIDAGGWGAAEEAQTGGGPQPAGGDSS